MPQICPERVRWCMVNTYHRRRWWPDDSSPGAEPTYSRSRDRPGRSPPKHNTHERKEEAGMRMHDAVLVKGAVSHALIDLAPH